MSRHHRYSGIAKGPRWDYLRGQILERDRYRCRKCGKPGRLEVHHVRPIEQGGGNDRRNLTTLCRDCHIRTHQPEPIRDTGWRQLLKEVTDGI